MNGQDQMMGQPQTAPPKQSNTTLWVLLVILAIVIIGTLVWYFMFFNK